MELTETTLADNIAQLQRGVAVLESQQELIKPKILEAQQELTRQRDILEPLRLVALEHQQELSYITKSLLSAKKELKELQQEQAAATTEAKKTPTTISHHAIVRYLERMMGLDMSDIEREIVPTQTQLQIYQLGDGKYPIGDGVRIVVKNNTVVTVV